MIIYHGTTEEAAINIRQKGIDYFYGNKEADFGQGFYLTDDVAFAKKCALRKACNKMLAKPALLSYNFDMKVAKASDAVLEFKYADLEWGQFIVNNRNGLNYVKAVNQTKHHNLFHNNPIVTGRVADGIIVRIAAILKKENRLLKLEELSDIISIRYPKQISLHNKAAEQFFIGDENPKLTILRRWAP